MIFWNHIQVKNENGLESSLSMKQSILIIGGGASGIMAAITAAKQNHTSVTVYEKNDRIGKKILATGNGKCNLSNAQLIKEAYYTDDEECLTACLSNFTGEDTIRFFEEGGLLLKQKGQGIYPSCEQAATVLDILRKELEVNHVHIVTEITNIQIIKQPASFLVKSNMGQENFDRIILACGSPAGIRKTEQNLDGYFLAEQTGHTVIKTRPSLCALRCRNRFLNLISGVRQEAMVSLYINHKLIKQEFGEIQFTDYGISGIAVFQLSHLAGEGLEKKKQVEVKIDFFRNWERQKWELFCTNRFNEYLNQPAEYFFLGLLHKKMSLYFMKMAGILEHEILSVKNRDKILNCCHTMREMNFEVSSLNPYENAQVCAGGIPLAEVFDTMESKKCKHLFLCGEMLNVDGVCGGYNLQWAWTSGYLAGKNAALTE